MRVISREKMSNISYALQSSPDRPKFELFGSRLILNPSLAVILKSIVSVKIPGLSVSPNTYVRRLPLFLRRYCFNNIQFFKHFLHKKFCYKIWVVIAKTGKLFCGLLIIFFVNKPVSSQAIYIPVNKAKHRGHHHSIMKITVACPM